MKFRSSYQRLLCGFLRAYFGTAELKRQYLSTLQANISTHLSDSVCSFNSFLPAVDNNSSIYQFDWKSKRLYATTLTKSSTVPSFCIPTVSDSELLLCGFPDCISYVSLPHLSDKAIRRKDVACKSSDLSQIDRGATLSDGTLLVSFIPGKYCDEDPGHPKAAAAYFDLKTHSFVDAVFPGFYSNGFAYDPKRKTLFMGDDCMPGVVAYQYDDLKKSFSKPDSEIKI